MRIAMTILSCAAAVWAQDAAQVEKMTAEKKALKDAVKQTVKEVLDDTIKQTMVVISGQMFNSNPVKGQPYSAEAVSETTQALADGNKIVRRSSTMVYRDSEGRERREEAIASVGTLAAQAQARPAKVVFISDPVAKVSYTLHPDEKTAEKMAPPGSLGKGTYQMRSQEYTVVVRTAVGSGSGAGTGVSTATSAGPELEPPAPSERNAKAEDLGTRTIEGIPAEGTRITTTIPAGEIGNERDINIVSERWFSKELGVLVMSTRSDPRTGETVYKLTKVNRTEPLHSMFEVPADYTVAEGGRRGIAIRKEEQ